MDAHFRPARRNDLHVQVGSQLHKVFGIRRCGDEEVGDAPRALAQAAGDDATHVAQRYGLGFPFAVGVHRGYEVFLENH